jgi:hypothetical protein
VPDEVPPVPGRQSGTSDFLQGSREYVGKAIEIRRECGADGWVEKYERELTALKW